MLDGQIIYSAYKKRKTWTKDSFQFKVNFKRKKMVYNYPRKFYVPNLLGSKVRDP